MKFVVFSFFWIIIFSGYVFSQDRPIQPVPDYRIPLTDEQTYFFAGIGANVSKFKISGNKNEDDFEYSEESLNFFLKEFLLNTGFVWDQYLLYTYLHLQTDSIPDTTYKNENFDRFKINTFGFGFFYKWSIIRNHLHVNGGMVYLLSSSQFKNSDTGDSSEVIYDQGGMPAVQLDWFLPRDILLKLSFAHAISEDSQVQQTLALTFNLSRRF